MGRVSLGARSRTRLTSFVMPGQDRVSRPEVTSDQGTTSASRSLRALAWPDDRQGRGFQSVAESGTRPRLICAGASFLGHWRAAGPHVAHSPPNARG